MGGAKRKFANVSFLASRLNEFNTGLNFIAGSCGGHGFTFGMGTTLRRCEELSIKPHYSSAKFEAGLSPLPPPLSQPQSPPSLPALCQVRGWTFSFGANTVGWWASGPKHFLDINIHAAGDAASRSLPHGAGQPRGDLPRLQAG